MRNSSQALLKDFKQWDFPKSPDTLTAEEQSQLLLDFNRHQRLFVEHLLGLPFVATSLLSICMDVVKGLRPIRKVLTYSHCQLGKKRLQSSLVPIRNEVSKCKKNWKFSLDSKNQYNEIARARAWDSYKVNRKKIAKYVLGVGIKPLYYLSFVKTLRLDFLRLCELRQEMKTCESFKRYGYLLLASRRIKNKWGLTANEMKEALSLISRHYDEAVRIQEKLVLANMPLVASISKAYQGHGVSSSDLMQAGALVLTEAIRKFDISLGVKFSDFVGNLLQFKFKKEIVEARRIGYSGVEGFEAEVLARSCIDVLENVGEPLEISSQTRDILSVLLAPFHPKQQEVFILTFGIEDGISLSCQECASKVGYTPNTVLTYRKMILKQMRIWAASRTFIDCFCNCGAETLVLSYYHGKILTTKAAIENLPKAEQNIVRLFFGISHKSRSIEECAKVMDLPIERVVYLLRHAVRTLCKFANIKK
jgi:RNA polymerase sigma factor (sigma-70 family)